MRVSDLLNLLVLGLPKVAILVYLNLMLMGWEMPCTTRKTPLFGPSTPWPTFCTPGHGFHGSMAWHGTVACGRWFAAEDVMASARKAEESFVQQLRAEERSQLDQVDLIFIF